MSIWHSYQIEQQLAFTSSTLKPLTSWTLGDPRYISTISCPQLMMAISILKQYREERMWMHTRHHFKRTWHNFLRLHYLVSWYKIWRLCSSSWDVPLPKREKDYEEKSKNSSDKASISIYPPQSSKKGKSSKKKRALQEESTYEKIKLGNGRTTYILWWSTRLDPSLGFGPDEHEFIKGVSGRSWARSIARSFEGLRRRINRS